MHCAIDICPLGELADPNAVVRLAVAAEEAGWDGLSIWDSLGTSMGAAAADPFVTLTAVAAATRRLRLITSVVALPRHRPQLVAQAAATLDRFSNGRLVLGVGSGGDPGDFEPFGESFDPLTRSSLLDVSLEQVDAWLRDAAGVSIGPTPVQQPRPPIWVGGMKPGALRRAARWDGWIAIGVSDDGAEMVLTPRMLAEMGARIQAARSALAPTETTGTAFDIGVFGYSRPDEGDLVAAFAAAGATWWLESLSPMRGNLDELLGRIEAGRPAGRASPRN